MMIWYNIIYYDITIVVTKTPDQISREPLAWLLSAIRDWRYNTVQPSHTTADARLTLSVATAWEIVTHATDPSRDLVCDTPLHNTVHYIT